MSQKNGDHINPPCSLLLFFSRLSNVFEELPVVRFSSSPCHVTLIPHNFIILIVHERNLYETRRAVFFSPPPDPNILGIPLRNIFRPRSSFRMWEQIFTHIQKSRPKFNLSICTYRLFRLLPGRPITDCTVAPLQQTDFYSVIPHQLHLIVSPLP